MHRNVRAAFLAAAFLAFGQARPIAQDQPKTEVRQAPAPIIQDTEGARETRDRLHRILRDYPPAVGEVLQRDPSLLTRQDYLAPYPALVAFLQQNPQIARNPSFFLGRFEYYEPRAADRSFEMFQVILAGVGAGLAGAAFLGVLIWVIRSIIDHRRWLRLSRTQAEVHTKLLDRLTTNEDLLTYIQSPAGRRFLESAPISLDQEPRMTNAPLARIIWSLQAGVVLAMLGVGFWFVQTRVTSEAAEGFFVIGVIALALGVGFTLSAIMAYAISTRLGLVHRPKAEEA